MGTGKFDTPKISQPSSEGMRWLSSMILQQTQQKALLQKQQQLQQIAQQQSQGNPADRFQIPAGQEQNYKIAPEMKDVGGIPTPFTSIKEKEPPPQAAVDALLDNQQFARKGQKLAQSVIDNPDLQGQLGIFHPSAHTGMMGDLTMSLRAFMEKNAGGAMGNTPGKAADFAAFKSGTQNIFQNYRKFLEGVRGAVGGSTLINPIYPRTEDPPEQYVSKALDVLDTMNQNDGKWRNYFDRTGYKTQGLGEPLNIDTGKMRDSAVQHGMNITPGGYNQSPIPGMNQQQNQNPSATAPGSQMDVNQERTLAKEIIAKGAPGDVVAKRFKQRTGQDL